MGKSKIGLLRMCPVFIDVCSINPNCSLHFHRNSMIPSVFLNKKCSVIMMPLRRKSKGFFLLKNIVTGYF